MNEEMSFEQGIKRLEEIVRALENPDVTLAEGLAMYKDGSECARRCRELLNTAKHELEVWSLENDTQEAEKK